MRILLDSHVLNGGGAVQVCLSLIQESLCSNQKHEWRYAVSPVVLSEWEQFGMEIPRSFMPLKGWPSSPLQGRMARRQLLALEESFDPHVVFTVFGPSYVIYKSPHLCGCAVGWTTHPSRIAYSTLTLSEALYFRTTAFKNKHLFRRSGYYWCESEAAKGGLMKLLGKGPEKVLVVPNTYSRLFENYCPTEWNGCDKIRLLTLSCAVPPQEPSNHSRRSFGASKGSSRFCV